MRTRLLAGGKVEDEAAALLAEDASLAEEEPWREVAADIVAEAVLRLALDAVEVGGGPA